MIRIGFTGTQREEAITEGQIANFRWVIGEYLGLSSSELDFEFHHGDCIGWDKLAHDIVTEMFPFFVTTYAHPGQTLLGRDVNIKRAYCKADVIEQPVPCLDRNVVIASIAKDALIACPAQSNEILRSGTWHTIRAAANLNAAKTTGQWQDRPIIIIPPHGDARMWNGTELSEGLIKRLGPTERTLFAL